MRMRGYALMHIDAPSLHTGALNSFLSLCLSLSVSLSLSLSLSPSLSFIIDLVPRHRYLITWFSINTLTLVNYIQ